MCEILVGFPEVNVLGVDDGDLCRFDHPGIECLRQGC